MQHDHDARDGMGNRLDGTGELDQPETYKIIRFRKSGNNKTVRRGLTLAEAQAHCSRADTRGKNWFDGFTKEGN